MHMRYAVGRPMSTEAIRPLWMRLWHGAQALLFLGLLVTGLSMHYAGTRWAFVPFPVAVRVHNTCGIATVALTAVEMIDGGHKPEPPWHARVSKILDDTEKPVAEVTIAALPAIRDLVNAAGSRD